MLWVIQVTTGGEWGVNFFKFNKCSPIATKWLQFLPNSQCRTYSYLKLFHDSYPVNTCNIVHSVGTTTHCFSRNSPLRTRGAVGSAREQCRRAQCTFHSSVQTLLSRAPSPAFRLRPLVWFASILSAYEYSTVQYSVRLYRPAPDYRESQQTHTHTLTREPRGCPPPRRRRRDLFGTPSLRSTIATRVHLPVRYIQEYCVHFTKYIVYCTGLLSFAVLT